MIVIIGLSVASQLVESARQILNSPLMRDISVNEKKTVFFIYLSDIFVVCLRILCILESTDLSLSYIP